MKKHNQELGEKKDVETNLHAIKGGLDLTALQNKFGNNLKVVELPETEKIPKKIRHIKITDPEGRETLVWNLTDTGPRTYHYETQNSAGKTIGLTVSKDNFQEQVERKTHVIFKSQKERKNANILIDKITKNLKEPKDNYFVVKKHIEQQNGDNGVVKQVLTEDTISSNPEIHSTGDHNETMSEKMPTGGDNKNIKDVFRENLSTPKKQYTGKKEEESINDVFRQKNTKKKIQEKSNFPETFTPVTTDGQRHTWMKIEDLAKGGAVYKLEGEEPSEANVIVKNKEDLDILRTVVQEKYNLKNPVIKYRGKKEVRSTSEKIKEEIENMVFPDTFTWPTADGILHPWIKIEEKDGVSIYALDEARVSVRTREDFQLLRDMTEKRYGAQAEKTTETVTEAKENKLNTVELIKGIKETESADGKWVVFDYIDREGIREFYRVQKEKADAERAAIIEKLKNGEQIEEEKIPEGEFKAGGEDIPPLNKEKAAQEKSASIKEKIAQMEKVTLEDGALTRINLALGKIGLGPENMKGIPGWDGMTEGQRMLVIHQYQNFYVENIKANAEKEYEKRFANAGFLKKIALRFGKTSKTRNIERELLVQMTSGGLNTEKKNHLTTLVEQTIAYDFKVAVIGNKLAVNFANQPSIEQMQSFSPEQKRVFDNYNTAVTALMSMPEEWGSTSATKKQRLLFGQAQELKNLAENELLKVKKELYGEETAIKEMNMSRAQADLVRFDLANPTIGKAIEDIRKTSMKDIVSRRDVFYGGLFFLGAGLRKLGITAPLVGAGMGGFRGWLKGKEKINKQDKMTRRGELTTATEAKSFFKGTTKDTTIQNITGKAGLTTKINSLITRINDATEAGEYKKAQELTRMLESRIEYTETKMKEARVNHGPESSRLQNRFELVNALTKARGVTSVYNSPEEYRKTLALIAERTIGYEALQDKKISTRRAVYLTERVIRGAIIGGTVAAAGKFLGNYLFASPEKEGIITGDTPTGEASGDTIPKTGDTPVKIPVINQWALAGKGDSPESLFIRQIEHRPDIAKALGYNGDLSDTKALHRFAGIHAHKIAVDQGYFQNIHNQVGINGEGIGKAAYQLEIGSDGKVDVQEYLEGVKSDALHESGTPFETDRENYEYLRDKKTFAGNTITAEQPDDYSGTTSDSRENTLRGNNTKTQANRIILNQPEQVGGDTETGNNAIGGRTENSDDIIKKYAAQENRGNQKQYNPTLPVIYPPGIPRAASILEQILGGIFGGPR